MKPRQRAVISFKSEFAPWDVSKRVAEPPITNTGIIFAGVIRLFSNAYVLACVQNRVLGSLTVLLTQHDFHSPVTSNALNYELSVVIGCHENGLPGECFL